VTSQPYSVFNRQIKTNVPGCNHCICTVAELQEGNLFEWIKALNQKLHKKSTYGSHDC